MIKSKNINNQSPKVANSGSQKQEFLSNNTVTTLKFSELDRWSRVLLWLLVPSWMKVDTLELMSRVRGMHKSNGGSFTVFYLKESHRLVLKCLSGHPETCKTFPRVATRRGLPLIIPGSLRLRIEANDLETIKVVLTCLSVYRVIKSAPIIKLSTILDPFKGRIKSLPNEEIGFIFRRYFKRGLPQLLANASLIPLTTSGPNSTISCLGSVLDALAFKDSPKLLNSLHEVSKVTGLAAYNLLLREIVAIEPWSSCLSETLKIKYLSNVKLGKLSKKFEAAGKVRIFAIADVWTQSVLKPLHDYLFEVLKKIEQDGTFDQLKPLKTLMTRGVDQIYSFDLSAATDRLPVDLQVEILTYFINREFALSWKSLLVDRPWYLGKEPLYYAVGQPMGAYSSWGMLALTHHFIVQIAANRVGHKDWFCLYAVLGDDVVIADKAVAQSYLSIMDMLGVDINLSKSLESNSLAEFAKRLVSSEEDLSPMSPASIVNLMNNFKELPNVVLDMVSRGVSVTADKVSKMIFDVKTDKLFRGKLAEKAFSTPIEFNTIFWSIVGPLGFIRGHGLSPLLGDSSRLSVDQLKIFLSIVDDVINKNLVKNFYEAQDKDLKLLHYAMGELVGIKDRLAELVGPISGLKNDVQSISLWYYMFIARYGTNPYGLPSNWKYPISGLPSTNFILSLMSVKTFHARFNEPVLLNWRDKIQIVDLDSTYNYVQESLRLYQSSCANVVDLNIDKRRTLKKRISSNRFKIYHELENELKQQNLDFFFKKKD